MLKPRAGLSSPSLSMRHTAQTLVQRSARTSRQTVGSRSAPVHRSLLIAKVCSLSHPSISLLSNIEIGLAVRRVKLTNLPVKANLKRIVRLVWGGSVLDFIYTDGQPCAEVLFVKPEDCKRYFDSTPNGIEYPGSKDRHIDVEACPPEPARGNVQEILARGMTRCVRVMDVEPDCSQLALEKIAAGKGNKRTVETIISGTDPKGVSLSLLCWMWY